MTFSHSFPPATSFYILLLVLFPFFFSLHFLFTPLFIFSSLTSLVLSNRLCHLVYMRKEKKKRKKKHSRTLHASQVKVSSKSSVAALRTYQSMSARSLVENVFHLCVLFNKSTIVKIKIVLT